MFHQRPLFPYTPTQPSSATPINTQILPNAVKRIRIRTIILLLLIFATIMYLSTPAPLNTTMTIQPPPTSQVSLIPYTKPSRGPTKPSIQTQKLSSPLHWQHRKPTKQCPYPPKAALIGIFTTSQTASAEKRTLLREKYRSMNSKLSPHLQIDIRFVFGNAHEYEQDYNIAVEEMLFPEETVVFEALEDRDSGKILDWFKYARNNMYYKSRDAEGEYCLRYKFVGKGDEDAVFELDRLGSKLVEISGGSGRYFGSTGMLYFLSADIVEWISFSPIPIEHLAGVEDVQVGKWLLEGGFDYKMEDEGLRFHDLEESHQWSPGPIKNYSRVVHWCKDMARMYRCISGLYDNWKMTPEIAHRLTLSPSLETRLNRFGFNASSTIIKEIQSLPHSNITLDQMDTLILTPSVTKWITKLSLDSELKEDKRTAIVHHVAIRGYLKKHSKREISILIVKFILRVANIPQFYAENSWKMNWNENGKANDLERLDKLVGGIVDVFGSDDDGGSVVDEKVVKELREMIGNDFLKEI
ncbi:UNVERIFIED_CONTAM: hypothetical protein HDU68_007397 [Siphonaria sp. JEL0065]|nr:hypothetical protein HDU68_007397 [Siphonaria sp. JEL0065]